MYTNNYKTKENIVLKGNSEVFKNWQSLLPNLTEEMFLSHLKWVCEDTSREIGLTHIGIVHLKRCKECGGEITVIRYEDGRLWNGDTFLVPCPEKYKKSYADENGMIDTTVKISINGLDRI